MGRILSVMLGLGLTCVLVTGLLGRQQGFAPQTPTDTLAVNPAQIDTTQPQKEAVSFPAQIPGTHLVAERLVCYEGPFIEDGSDRPVTDICALVIRNGGESTVSEASVTMERAGERYEFFLTCLLPGMSVMVLESTAAPCLREPVTDIRGWERMMEGTNLLPELRLTALDMGTLELTNPSREILAGLTLYHKNYLPDGTFVGGITYITTVEALDPGETIVITPEHYADGYSRVFFVK